MKKLLLAIGLMSFVSTMSFAFELTPGCSNDDAKCISEKLAETKENIDSFVVEKCDEVIEKLKERHPEFKDSDPDLLQAACNTKIYQNMKDLYESIAK